ncbi:MAG: cation:proton antiporter, partial [Candidatus Cloacimonadota bacterium]|nr:cation:proton antiporter [Candidatus Cloacimonadota bacterium]
QNRGKMSAEYLLFFLGFSILVALFFSKGARLLRIPMIVGYIVAGAILGPDISGFISRQQIASLDVVNIVVLSLIGFGIGGELQLKKIKKLGKSIVIIVFFEAMGAFLLVGTVTALLLKSVPLGLIYGSLASATAPAGTVEVIKQYKAKGNFTTTLYAVMGLDDIISLLLFSLSLPLAVILLVGQDTGTNMAVLPTLGAAGLEILLSILIGIVAALLVMLISRVIQERVNLMLFALAVILINCSVAEHLGISPILLNMTFGIVLVNRSKLMAQKVFSILGEWSPPMYVWFFIIIGTRLDIEMISKYAILVLLYILARTVGKILGVFLGGSLSHSSKSIKKYLGLALMSQAGVAVGLALAAAKVLEANGLHNYAIQIMSTITATTFIVMLIGPIFAKVALLKSNETNISG